MPYIEVALNVPLNQTFTYSYKEEEHSVSVGKRVEVPFGARKLIGFVVAKKENPPINVPKEKIRSIRRVVDEEPLLTKELLNIALWMKDYYICTLGETLSAIIPSGKRESKSIGFSFEEELPVASPLALSDEQKNATQNILSSKNIFHYLYGKTGTGKTEVFLQVAQKILEERKGVIYLVPEISLTSQVLDTVTKRFGNQVASIHSSLTKSEKLKEWNRILKKEARIVIGARSAIFAPVPDLGLIIIDEEHDSSYKSGNTPRYHARQVAMYRASTLNIPLVMGSATPSVEAWHLMKEKKFVPHSLTKRLAGGSTPSIMCIDLKSEKDSSCISKKLQEEIQNTLNQKKQTILFLNRRGFTHFFKCSNCSYEMICKNCSVPMTYHKKDHLLKCHYCGWAQSPVSSCPECGSLDIGYHGFGTEYIEAETKAKFPNARVLRIDTDSISQKGELEEKINSFREGKYDILLGTQMVAKGLNFPNLLLVGIILADTGLHMPDFRSYERTFALITQVAGRAGRFFPNGKVIVQTYSPKVEPIAFACNGNTSGFYKQELDKRCMLEFPPFSRIARLVFRSANSKSANLASNDAHKILSEIARNEKLNVEILGPGECPIFKISKNYRYQILLRSKNVKALQHLSKTLLFGYTKAQDVYIECDIDPVHLL